MLAGKMNEVALVSVVAAGAPQPAPGDPEPPDEARRGSAPAAHGLLPSGTCVRRLKIGRASCRERVRVAGDAGGSTENAPRAPRQRSTRDPTPTPASRRRSAD